MVQMSAANWYFFAVLGLLAGITSGALGVGSGIIVIPALVFFLGATQKEAQGTALAVMIVMAIMGTIRYAVNPEIKLYLWGIIVLSLFAIVGSNIGSNIAFALPAPILKKIFAVFIILVGLRMLFK
jgi:uncharacterized protein